MAGDDENRPVWAIGIFFFFFCVLFFFFDFLGSIYILKAHGGFGWATSEETGPNDASHVIWAIGF